MHPFREFLDALGDYLLTRDDMASYDGQEEGHDGDFDQDLDALAERAQAAFRSAVPGAAVEPSAEAR